MTLNSSYKFRVILNPSLDILASLDHRSHFSLVFEQPSYWMAISQIVEGELGLAFLECEVHNKIAAWIPFILIRKPGVSIINSMPYYGSHGGPYGPQTDSYGALLDQFASYAKTEEVDTFFLSSSVSSDRYIASSSTYAHKIDTRIGQITSIPSNAPDITQRIYDMLHTKTRNAVRKGYKTPGVELIVDDDDITFNYLVPTHVGNIKTLGGVPKEANHFSIMKSMSDSNYRVRSTAIMLNGEFGCGIISLITPKCYEYFTPAINPDFRDKQLLSRLIFEEMQYCASQQISFWNWGGTWLSQEGVYRFKSRWGAKDYPYSYILKENTSSLRNYCQANKNALPFVYKYRY